MRKMKEVNQAKGSVYVEINKSTKVNKWNKKAKKLISTLPKEIFYSKFGKGESYSKL